MNLWSCSVREIRRRPGRTLLTLLGITLGLATVVATRLTIDIVSQTYRDLFDGTVGEPALEVTSSDLSSFDPSALPDLKSLPQIHKVIPRIRAAAGLVGPSGSVTVALLGADGTPQGEHWPLCQGRNIETPDDALLDGVLADSLGLVVGQPLQLWTPAGLIALHLAGTLEPRGSSAGAGGLLIVSLDRAGQLLNFPPHHVNCLRLVLHNEADMTGVQTALSSVLPPTLTVHMPGAEGGLARSTLRAAEQGLSALSALALITAGFVILNTFLLNVGERRRQLSVLKTLGATRGQLFRLLLGEAVLLGIVGTVLGCLAGTALAMLLERAMGRFLGVALPSIPPRLGSYLPACLLGPAVPLLAVCVPAWQVSRRPPLAELLPHREEHQRTPFRLGLAGLLFLGVGLVLLSWHGRGQDVLPVAIGLLLIGSVLAFPLVLPILLRLLGKLPLRLEGNLALHQLNRHRTRTGLTAGILFLTLTVTAGFGQSLRGILRDMRQWYRQTIVADFLIRGSMPDTSFVLATALPESLAGELARLDGVAAVDRIAFLPTESSGRPVLVLARTFPAMGPLPLDLREGEADGVRKGLLQGEVVLGTGLASQLGLHRGDCFPLNTPHGAVQLRIAGTAAEFAGGGAALYMEWQAAHRLLAIPGVHVFLVTAQSGGLPLLTPALRKFCEPRHLLVQSNADLRGLIDQLLVRVTGAIWALMVLVFVVASLGIVNTLHMNIQDQAQTFALLRALGLRNRQVIQLVVAQAALLSGLSLLPGVLAGLALAFAICLGSASWAGVPISFCPDWSVLSVSALASLFTALLASLLPARRAIDSLQPLAAANR